MPESREDRIRRIVDGMPPLTDEALAKLTVLLQPETRTLEARSARARIAVRRWQAGSSEEQLLADLQAAKDNDDQIDQVVARAPKMTAEQAARVRHIFKYLPERDDGERAVDDPATLTREARIVRTAMERLSSSRRSEISGLADELDKLGQEAATDAKILTDLRKLRSYLANVISRAEADSPVVAERKRRGRISYLEGELARLRDADA